MASIFKKDDNFVDKPNRNPFDLSWQNNLTTKFGRLVPCFCQEVLPGDSFKITPTFGLRYLPQVFPVQTRMKAHIHFFYVRNRTIWKDWMDFIGKTKTGLTLPYLTSGTPSLFENDKNMYESSIYDYMGLPVVLDSEIDPVGASQLWSYRGDIKNVQFEDGKYVPYTKDYYSVVCLSSSQLTDGNNYMVDGTGNEPCLYREIPRPVVVCNDYGDSQGSLNITMVKQASATNIKVFCYCEVAEVANPTHVFNAFVSLGTLSSQGYTMSKRQVINVPGAAASTNFNVFVKRIFGTLYYNADVPGDVNFMYGTAVSYTVIPSLNRNYPFTSLAKQSLPYGSEDTKYRINALPFRAYEAVYNSFYRNAENNPFLIDGVPEYNRYVKSMEGGAQSTDDFALFNRNWEDDAFTTAVPTPQQTLNEHGAPRVGLSATPGQAVELNFYDEDGNSHLVLLEASNTSGRVGMVLVDDGVSSDLSTALNSAVNFGITINDLRNVNALQLWLEKNVRRGFKYKDQIMSHYGVKVDYNELMMPEFIGGVSRDVTVNQISQTVETESGNLGDMAGQAYVVGEGHSIQRYCDEHGYIIGIMSVVPVPNYSQLIPKHFFKHDTFDYFFPEFGHIGMQPITCKEIAATASWLSNRGDEVFGYQRAWYDYLARVDEVHGKFNSEFYNYLIQRKFGDVPELGKNFTTIINSDLNNIFYVDDGEDKILGQIYFDVTAIRPIPLFGIPSLT